MTVSSLARHFITTILVSLINGRPLSSILGIKPSKLVLLFHCQLDRGSSRRMAIKMMFRIQFKTQVFILFYKMNKPFNEMVVCFVENKINFRDHISPLFFEALQSLRHNILFRNFQYSGLEH